MQVNGSVEQHSKKIWAGALSRGAPSSAFGCEFRFVKGANATSETFLDFGSHVNLGPDVYSRQKLVLALVAAMSGLPSKADIPL